MKKIWILVLCLVLFSSCSTVPTEQTGDSTYTEQLGNFTQNGGIVLPENMLSGISIFSYSEYCKFLKNTELPDSFVTYEQIKELGEFEGIVFLPKDTHVSDTFNRYMYSLVDENGVELSLYVYQNEVILPDDASVVSSDTSDLRNLKTPTSGIRQIGDIYYRYDLGGSLVSIMWITNQTKFSLSANDSGLGSYPTDKKETVVSKLLDRSTAEKEVQEIEKKIAAKGN